MIKTLFSVNVNKFALIRNSRGNNQPDLLRIIENCIAYGAQGITVHPRPDGRHILYSDLDQIKAWLLTHAPKIEFNIEGYPSRDFLNKVIAVCPDQVTLVPDPPEALTSSNGWDLKKEAHSLRDIILELKAHAIRTSLFINPSLAGIETLPHIQTDRVELYTFDYARQFNDRPEMAIAPYRELVVALKNLPVDINAGHDLNAENLSYFLKELKVIKEVSIGHALVCDALDLGLKSAIKNYLECFRKVS